MARTAKGNVKATAIARAFLKSLPADVAALHAGIVEERNAFVDVSATTFTTFIPQTSTDEASQTKAAPSKTGNARITEATFTAAN